MKVTFLGEIRSAIRRRDMEVAPSEAATVGDLLSYLSNQLGAGFNRLIFREDGDLFPHVSIFVNGKDFKSLAGLETRLEDGDIDILIVPVYGGG
ncbi:MAG: MoaD/ThiS family protein [Dehalococcoidia bacterium]|nr:MoaD/ThiS family protein [Dehalococcoidia bacterium]